MGFGLGVGLGAGLGLGFGVGCGAGLGVVLTFTEMKNIETLKCQCPDLPPQASNEYFPKLLSFTSEQEDGSVT